MFEYLSFLIGVPLALIYKKVTGFDSRVSIVETKQEAYELKVDKMCESSKTLEGEVHELIGQVKEHLRITKS